MNLNQILKILIKIYLTTFRAIHLLPDLGPSFLCIRPRYRTISSLKPRSSFVSHSGTDRRDASISAHDEKRDMQSATGRSLHPMGQARGVYQRARSIHNHSATAKLQEQRRILREYDVRATGTCNKFGQCLLYY